MAKVYFQIDDIKGNATEEGHKDWIDVTRMEWADARSFDGKIGSGGRREASLATVQDIKLVKGLDSASPKLWVASLSGNATKKGKLHFLTPAGSVYLEISLEGILISGYHIESGEVGANPVETITLNVTKAEMKYTPFDKDNKPSSPIACNYDFLTAKAG